MAPEPLPSKRRRALAAAVVVAGLFVALVLVVPIPAGIGPGSPRAAASAMSGGAGATSRGGSQHTVAVSLLSLPLATLHAVNEGAHGAPSGGPGSLLATIAAPVRPDGMIGRWAVVFLLFVLAVIWVVLVAMVVRVRFGLGRGDPGQKRTHVRSGH